MSYDSIIGLCKVTENKYLKSILMDFHKKTVSS